MGIATPLVSNAVSTLSEVKKGAIAFRQAGGFEIFLEWSIYKTTTRTAGVQLAAVKRLLALKAQNLDWFFEVLGMYYCSSSYISLGGMERFGDNVPGYLLFRWADDFFATRMLYDAISTIIRSMWSPF